MRDALNLTIRAYNRLIQYPEKNAVKWEDYGFMSACRMCKQAYTKPERVRDCRLCPLVNAWSYGCRKHCLSENSEKLKAALRENRIAGIEYSARARRDEIIELIEKRYGWEWNGKMFMDPNHIALCRRYS
jgi:hypothetical protein